MSFFSLLGQDVQVPPALSSTANLNAYGSPGDEWTSASVSTLRVVGLQINLCADQNCKAYVEQSPDNFNWDIVDGVDYVAAYGGQGWTIQATASYVRVRVRNQSASATTFFRFQTALCPIVESLPRALTRWGNLKTAMLEMKSEFNANYVVDPTRSLKVTESTRLVGAAFCNHTFDNATWQTSTAGSGVAAVSGGYMALNTGITPASSARVVTNHVARFVYTCPNYWVGTVRFPAAVGANERRIGAYDASNGYFFVVDTGVFGVGIRSGGINSVTWSGSFFGGVLGNSYVMDDNFHRLLIVWSAGVVYFEVDNELLHVASATTTVQTEHMSLPAVAECVNGANVNDNALWVAGMAICRLGKLLTQPMFLNITTQTTTVVKPIHGNLHRIMINKLPTVECTVTVYDNIVAAGTKIGTMSLLARGTAPNTPTSIDYGGINFSTGLTVVTAGANPDITVVFD